MNLGITIASIGKALMLLTFIAVEVHSDDSPSNGPTWIWWEAEDFAVSNLLSTERNPFAPANDKEAEVLSGRKWVGISGEYGAEIPFLEYLVDVPKDATYHFYVRKFWKHGPFRWRFDDQDYSEVGRDITLLDEEELRQYVVANWIYAGQVSLSRGQHNLRIEIIESKGAAAFDCFMLTTQIWFPKGKLKPGERLSGSPPEGWFIFDPETDTFDDSPIDLRHLNEPFAGSKGFIVAKDGELIYEATGESLRFWGVNAGPDIVQLPKPYVDYLARHLAKLGFNIVRAHGKIWRDDDFKQIDQSYLDKLFYFINAMSKEGIYTAISFYFPLWLRLSSDDFAGYNNQHPFALLFFNEEFKQIYKGWLRAMLTTRNPYNDSRLVDTPAVALLELINEDSFLFWTFNYDNVPSEQMINLEREFALWLEGKYGSLNNAYSAWNQRVHQRDDLIGKRIGFIHLWEIANQRDKRSQDTAEFLTLKQKAFFEDAVKFVKHELGFKGLVICSNWITADERVLGPLDKWSNLVGDVIDRHGYFSGEHKGERAGWSISEGDEYNDRCALLEPNEASFSLPVMDITYNHKPSVISEVNWTPPNKFRADFPVLCSVYGSLQGSDGFFFFALNGPYWQRSLTKFAIQTPTVLGQSPALSLLFRKGLVKTGDVVYDIQLKLSDLFALKGAPIKRPVNLDQLRLKDVPLNEGIRLEEIDALDPLAFFVGRVLLNMSEQGDLSKVHDLSEYIDRDKGIVRSNSGELLWDYGKGLILINAPSAQGVTGFLNKIDQIALRDVSIATQIQYGSIILVALDDRSIDNSNKLLLQVMTEETNTNWKVTDNGTHIIQDLGGPPILVRECDGTISLKRADADQLKVLALDSRGYVIKQIGTAERFELVHDVIYYLVEK